jgi:hypothetical protein
MEMAMVGKKKDLAPEVSNPKTIVSTPETAMLLRMDIIH